ncbi:MAG: ketol-acid reductoisomerase [Candidatus Marinimicrobia bacterium]|nr:ketol-acid reductoisomerase [Candidatus Neomarinimicrobiota bacterium]
MTIDKELQNSLYFDKDADLSLIQAKVVAIIGYGNQGRAQALNLRDSGVKVVVGAREGGGSEQRANTDGFDVFSIQEAVRTADVIAILLPDQVMATVYNESIKSNLSTGKILQFSHGYNIHYGKIVPPQDIDVMMVAPSGAGKMVRQEFEKGSGVPNLIAIHQDYSGNTFNLALSYSKAIGGTRTAVFKSTFKEETETDLFGEQVVLTGGIPKLIQNSFKVMVESGYNPITAWFVSYYEVKLIVDLFNENGFQFMNDAISDTAEYGGQTRGNRLMDDSATDKMKMFLNEIQSGEFFKEWEAESQSGLPHLEALREKDANSDFESVSKILLNAIYKNNSDS